MFGQKEVPLFRFRQLNMFQTGNIQRLKILTGCIKIQEIWSQANFGINKCWFSKKYLGRIYMERLLNGYRSFLKDVDLDVYTNLADGQKPHTFVISCSDSRIIPEDIFSAKPGELFVLRNVGNIARFEEPGVLSAIEYALLHLKVENVVILSHSDCGAVKALSDPDHLDTEGLKAWLSCEGYKGRDLEEAIKFHAIRQYAGFMDNDLVKRVRETRKLRVGLFYFHISSLRLERFTGEKWDEVR